MDEQSHIDSLDLARNARAGNEEAKSSLFARYDQRLRRIARIRMGSKLRQWVEVDDLLQNTFVVASRKLDEFEPHSHAAILQWFARILENQIRDELDRMTAGKRDQRRVVPLATGGESSSADHAAVDRADSTAGPRTRAERLEVKEIYDTCVEELPPDEREAVLMREYEQASWSEIAAKLGRPGEDAVRELHRRARVRLAAALAKRLGRIE